MTGTTQSNLLATLRTTIRSVSTRLSTGGFPLFSKDRVVLGLGMEPLSYD